MLNLKSIRNSLVFAGVAIGVVAQAPVAAQAQQAPADSWYKVCSKQDDNDICTVQYSIRASTGQLVTGVSLFTIKGKINRKVFQIIVPTGRAVSQGVEVQIDKNKAVKLPYSLCFPDRCLADVNLSDNLVAALKKGNNILVTTTNFQGKKNPVTISLNGFTAAFDGPATKSSDLAAKQKKLQEDLQKKAEATRKKLEEAQKKAKEAN